MKRAFPFILFLLVAFFLISCGKNKNEIDPEEDANSTWTLGGRTYKKGTSSQLTTPDAGTDRAITVITAATTGNGGNHGEFSGSAITFTFYSSLGDGTYIITSKEMMVANPSKRYLTVDCTVGTARSTGSVLYAPIGNSEISASVVKDSKGDYHVLLETPVTLTKQVTTGGGINHAAETYPLTIKNVY